MTQLLDDYIEDVVDANQIAPLDISPDRNLRLQRLLQYRRDYDIAFFHYVTTKAYVITCGQTVVACDPEAEFPSEQTIASLHLLISSGLAKQKWLEAQQAAGAGGGGVAVGPLQNLRPTRDIPINSAPIQRPIYHAKEWTGS